MKKELAIIACSLVTAISAVSLSACGTSPSKPVSDDYVGTYSAVNETPEIPSKESPSSPTVSTTNSVSDKNVAERINSFSTVMLREAYENSTDGNVLISPMSLYTALALTANGADNRTAKEMTDVLSGYYNYDNGIVCYAEYAPLTCDEMNGFFQRYMAGIESDKDFPLKMANSMWLDNQRVSFKDDFIGIGKYCYNADLFEEEFSPKTKDSINSWAEEKTDGRINNLLADWNEDIVSVLVNALTFDGKWVTPYRADNVSSREFTNADNSTAEIDMMTGTENYYFDDGTATGFIKNYQGNRFVYAAVMPNEDITLKDYIDSEMPKLTVDYIIENSEGCTLTASMPKFETECSFAPLKPLQSLGMKDAFDGGLADLSKLGTSNDGRNLYISNIVHKTYVKFFEEGTEAAAATAVIIEKENCVEISEKSVILNRPYIYFIFDKQENIPVFAGTVSHFDNK